MADDLRIGIAGLGFMGLMHSYGVWGKGSASGRRVRGARITAMASRDAAKRGGDWTAVQGNYGPRGGKEDLSGIRVHERVEELLADPGVDAVHLCLPNPLHRPAAEAALAAGKHVLVEKPIALTEADADAMLAAANSHGRTLLVAHVLPFMGEFAWLAAAVREGRFGRLRGAQLKRLVARTEGEPDPRRLFTYGGMGIDLHIHDTHFVLLLFGPPRRVYSRGLLVGDGYLDYVSTLYEFDDAALQVSCTSGGLSAPARPFTHGFEMYFDGATVQFETGGPPLTVFRADGKVERPDLPARNEVDAFTDEIQAAVDTFAGKAAPGPLAADRARDALSLVQAEAESVRRGQPVEFGGRGG